MSEKLYTTLFGLAKTAIGGLMACLVAIGAWWADHVEQRLGQIEHIHRAVERVDSRVEMLCRSLGLADADSSKSEQSHAKRNPRSGP